jgi:hypothetical protein
MTKRQTRKRGGSRWSYNYTYCEKNGKQVACKQKQQAKSVKSVKTKKNGYICIKTKNGKRVACTKKEQAKLFEYVWPFA